MGKACTFDRINMTEEEFRTLVNQNRTDAFYIAGLTAVALCNYKYDPDKCINMLNILRNPHEPMGEREINNIKERLSGREYIPFSYFAGAIQFNDFTPKRPYTVLVKDNKFTFYNEGWAELWMHSSGDTADRPVRLRCKISSGQWYLTEQMLTQDITLVTYDDEEEDDDDPWG
ncbi:MAG: hypothetical protein IKH65_06920 [Clostridia bacterium]|nr:hypothetical protein [Clostridia bacterium]